MTFRKKKKIDTLDNLHEVIKIAQIATKIIPYEGLKHYFHKELNLYPPNYPATYFLSIPVCSECEKKIIKNLET